MTFPWPFQIFQDLRFSCQFQKFKNFPSFRVFFWPERFNRHKTCHPKMCATYAVQLLLSILTLPLHCHLQLLIYQKTLIFHDFLGFLWPVQTLQIVWLVIKAGQKHFSFHLSIEPVLSRFWSSKQKFHLLKTRWQTICCLLLE